MQMIKATDAGYGQEILFSLEQLRKQKLLEAIF